MEDKTLATEVISELKVSNRKWFIAFLVALFIVVAETCVFIWYIFLSVAEDTIEPSIDEDSNPVVDIEELDAENDT